MWLRVLGSAAGGGYPQWNCNCPVCDACRRRTSPCVPRTQSSVAVSADRQRWVLLNVSPDVRTQIEATPELRPRSGRATPVQSVLLTDAELDHTLGLLLLREADEIELHATPAVAETLREGTAILKTLEQYCTVRLREVRPGADVALGNGLSYRAFEIPTTKRARFGPTDEPGRVVGYRMTDANTGGSAVYAPCAQIVPEDLTADCVLLDGTCFTDDELIDLGMAAKTSRSMGHVPIDGPDGSLERLEDLKAGRKIYVHMNNTNPILLEDSPQRAKAAAAGFEVAVDGMEVQV